MARKINQEDSGLVKGQGITTQCPPAHAVRVLRGGTVVDPREDKFADEICVVPGNQ